MTLIKSAFHERGQGVSSIDVIGEMALRLGHGLLQTKLQVVKMTRLPHYFSLLKELLMKLIDPFLVLSLFAH